MENKVKMILEIDRAEYDAFLFLMGHKKDEESERAWEIMKEELVIADFSRLEEERAAKFMMISLALLSVESKING